MFNLLDILNILYMQNYMYYVFNHWNFYYILNLSDIPVILHIST